MLSVNLWYTLRIMNMIGYKFLDESHLRRSAEELKMEIGESLPQFKKRCKDLGFECCDAKNVINRYKELTTTLIKADLNERKFNFSVFLQNLSGDFNKASIIRNCSCFCGQEVILFGSKEYDRRGTCGAHSYLDFQHVKEVSELDGFFEQYDIVIAIDNIENSIPIQTYEWDYNAKTLFVFGEESLGICPEILDRCHTTLYIPQFGPLRSLNVSSASAIVFHEYTRKFYKDNVFI